MEWSRLRAFDPEIEAFLDAYPMMRHRPTVAGAVRLAGRLVFSAFSEGLPELGDEYRVQIDIAKPLDQSLPQVFETGGRIARERVNHVNPDGSLCLGSLLSQRLVLGAKPTLTDFVEKCVIPFLYAHSLREQGLALFPFGELEHGEQGLIDDYLKIFGMPDSASLRLLMKMLALKRRRANKLSCICGCGRRFAACGLHARAHAARRTLSRLDIKRAYKEIWFEDAH
ncbi:hypothetical protein SQW15_27155 [Pseudomonas asiatica]|uniref:hypothetical protein n=1 Tax=Pseudomonas asiatica TaxID=2219225 RepID=UPI002ABDD724|nr:hypothetical protein [Pseudomonas asiatica]WPU60322.1 hypothetical protein SQW15_27155 [Pseudomonas asiatica]